MKGDIINDRNNTCTFVQQRQEIGRHWLKENAMLTRIPLVARLARHRRPFVGKSEKSNVIGS